MSGASEHAARWLFRGILVTLPWIGMGAVRCLTGVDTGAGFQPAYILLPPALVAALIAASADRAVRPAPAFRGRWWPWALSVAVILISWFGLSIAAGAATPAEARLRFLKQLIQYLLMLGYVALPVIMLDRDERWRDVPRWLAAGMLLQLAYGVGQAVHFGHPMEWFAALEGLFTSNPSILAGSEELFLGDAFAGVPRIRGTACEPLYLGNYLLAVAPWLVLAARRDRRWWTAAIARGTSSSPRRRRSSRASAAMVFSVTFAPAIDWAEPTIRNSNLSPVKAKGDVRLRSVLSFGITGRVSTPTWRTCESFVESFSPFAIFSRMSVNSSPMKMEMMAGGASLAPRR